MDAEKLSRFSDDSVGGSIRVANSDDDVEATTTPPSSAQTLNKFCRENETALMDSVIVNNEKVRYYYNKTLCLRYPIVNMLENLESLHSDTFAYLSQLPETGDYSVISTLFELIPTISAMIEWNSLNHSCYWEDFCRETKQLMNLLDKVNGASLKCSDTATLILARAQELFQGIEDNVKRPLKIDRAIAFRKASDYVCDNASGQSIQINWEKPGDSINLSWHDADGGLLNVPLKQTGNGFRLRFLRHIIYHAHCLLERAYLIFMKVNVSLHLHIPIEKLMKCKDVKLKQLTHQEFACLVKAKREFNSNLDLVWQMISRFKFQTFHLLKYSTTFKGMRNSPKKIGYVPKPVPTFAVVNMNINDSLLMRVMSSGIQAQANEESFDFTVFPDRTEDIIAKVEDLLVVDSTDFREFNVLLSIVKIIFPSEKTKFTPKEAVSIKDEIEMILAHRFQVRRTLKKSLKIFENHPAFNKMEALKLLAPAKHISRKVYSNETNSAAYSSGGSETQLEDNIENGISRDGNNNEQGSSDKVWITIEGGIEVTAVGPQTVLTKCPSNNYVIKNYNDLHSDEKVILCVRIMRQLLVLTANEQCMAKITHARIAETKSLVKRLKMKDRLNVDLQKVILEINRHLRLLMQLTKIMRFLKE